MITTISMPIWILVAVVGIADICLFCWCLALLRRSRKSNLRAASPEEASPSVQPPWASIPQFQQNLFSLQIDAVFDGLTALINAERIKLKSLLGQSSTSEFCTTGQQESGPDQSDDRMDEHVPEEKKADINQQIAQIAASGTRPAGIANQLGISLAEVELAMKMQAGRRVSAAGKLEAVA